MRAVAVCLIGAMGAFELNTGGFIPSFLSGSSLRADVALGPNETGHIAFYFGAATGDSAIDSSKPTQGDVISRSSAADSDKQVALQPVRDAATPVSELPVSQSHSSLAEGPAQPTDAAPIKTPSAQFASSCAFGAARDITPQDKLLRVSFPTAGGLLDGYGVEDATLPHGLDNGSPLGFSLPFIAWVRAQGGLSGYRGAGYEQKGKAAQLPSFLGATSSEEESDYALSMAHEVVDFMSVGRGDYAADLNPWYHSLNAGFRVRIIGELPCTDLSDLANTTRAGAGAGLTAGMRSAIDANTVYVSDGKSTFYDFRVDGHVPNSKVGDEIKLAAPTVVTVTAVLSAQLGDPHTVGAPQTQMRAESGWNIERTRIGDTQSISLDVVVNGKVVASRPVTADGREQSVTFKIPVPQSSWVALRLMGSAHTNPVYVIVDNKPVRGSRSSVEWLMHTLVRDYDVKNTLWNADYSQQARAAYQFAYAVYGKILGETTAP